MRMARGTIRRDCGCKEVCVIYANDSLNRSFERLQKQICCEQFSYLFKKEYTQKIELRRLHDITLTFSPADLPDVLYAQWCNRTDHRTKAPRTKDHRIKSHLFSGGTGQNLTYSLADPDGSSLFFFDKPDENFTWGKMGRARRGAKWGHINNPLESMFTRLTKNQGQMFRGCAEMFSDLQCTH